jgi:ferredoxin
MNERLHVDMILCDGHGICAELVPELIGVDEWGYPLVAAEAVPQSLRRPARRAVALCPKLALSMRPAQARPARDPAPPAALTGARPRGLPGSQHRQLEQQRPPAN